MINAQSSIAYQGKCQSAINNDAATFTAAGAGSAFEQSRSQPGKKKFAKRKKYKSITIAAVILVVTGYLIYTGLRDTMIFYLTVSEVLAQPMGQPAESLKVGGTVTPGSVQWDPKTLKLSFKLADEKANLTINYTGVVPDSFKPGAEVIVEGAYQGNGNFLAAAIMPKCASKYE